MQVKFKCAHKELNFTDAEVEACAKEGRGNAHAHHSADVVTSDHLTVQRTRALHQPVKAQIQSDTTFQYDGYKNAVVCPVLSSLSPLPRLVRRGMKTEHREKVWGLVWFWWLQQRIAYCPLFGLVDALCLLKQLVIMTIPLGTSRDRKEDKWRLQWPQGHLTL